MKTKIKKIMALLLSFVMVLSLFGCEDNNYYIDETKDELENNNTGETIQDNESDNENSSAVQRGATKYEPVLEVPEGYVGIYSVEDLLKISINPNMNYILMNDLDLSSINNWPGLSNDAIFDGNGHTIYNLKSNCSGLFDTCNIVYNVALENVEIELIVRDVLGSFYCGALANSAENMIVNCTASGKIEVVSTSAQPYETVFTDIGGLVGKSYKCYIGTSTNYVSIKCDTRNIPDSGIIISCGGIVGNFIGDEESISNCVNYGEVDVYYSMHKYGEEYWGRCGGIVGESDSTYISECSNYGDITSSDSAGGIIGESSIGKSSLYMASCDNFGTISLHNDGEVIDEDCSVGGIVGRLYGSGNVYIDFCDNYGVLEQNNIISSIGSIIAKSGSCALSLKNCTYIDNSDYNGISVNMDGKGGLYPDSYNNKMISLSEAQRLYPDWFSKNNT